MEARRFPEPEVVGSIPTAGGFGRCQINGGVAQMVERSLSMREVQGSIPCISSFPVAGICNGAMVWVPATKQYTSRGARTHDHKVKSLALYRLS